MTRLNISHIDLNDFKQVIELVDSCKLQVPLIPQYTPPQDGYWYNPETLEKLESLPSSLYCVDVETINDTKVLAMGSAWDILNQCWWVMITEPGSNPRIIIEGKVICIAHRSTFELTFFKNSYDLDCQIRFLDTHVMACNKYHPAQIELYRQQPYLKMFKESNDLSLAELSLHLCNRPMDKNDVEVFKIAKDDSWRESKLIISKHCEVAIKKAFICQKKEENTICETWEDYLFEICPDGTMASLDTTTLIKPSKKMMSLKKLWWVTPHIDQLCIYNYTDVACTVGVFANMWLWYREMPYEHIAGLYHRSIPLLPLANDWFEKVNIIEEEFSKRVCHMVELVNKVEQEYLEVVGENDWDLLDWGKWGNGSKDKTKIGNYKWINTTGLSSKKLMRLSRLFYLGRPMFVLADSKVNKEGEVVVKINGEDSQVQVWHTCEYDGISWLSSVKASKDIQRLDNPTNTTGDYKDIVTVFSKSFLPHWSKKQIMAESLYAQEIANTYATISFWNSFRDRVHNKMMVFNNGEHLSLCLRPQVAGAVSGRAIDNIGLVLSTPQLNKVGSELGGYFCCPDGYKFVFADFDSIQAVIIALYAAIAEAKELGIANKPINCLNNPFSTSVLVGEKRTKSTLAWLLAKQINPNWETEWVTPEMEEGESLSSFQKRIVDIEKSVDRAYSLGKTVQYAMLFGAGLSKLIILCGSETVATNVIKYFKGEFSKTEKKYVGGIASGYFNYCRELATGTTFLGGRFYKIDNIESSFLGRGLPNILKPSNRGKDLSMTAMNVVTQAIDVDCLNYVTNGIITQCSQENIFLRYSTSVHDALYTIAKDEDVERVREIFQEQHVKMYEALLSKFNIDISTFPKAGLRYSGVDVNSRWTKHEGDLGKTLSNQDGYDYEVTASFLYPEESGVVFPDDFISTKSIIKTAKLLISAQENREDDYLQ